MREPGGGRRDVADSSAGRRRGPEAVGGTSEQNVQLSELHSFLRFVRMMADKQELLPVHAKKYGGSYDASFGIGSRCHLRRLLLCLVTPGS